MRLLLIRLLLFLFLFFNPVSILAKPITVIDLHFWKLTPLKTRLVFDLSAPVTHNMFTLKSPNRLVIDLKNTKLVKKLRRPKDSELVKNIRSAPRHKNDLRVVLDLKVPVRAKSFLRGSKGTNGHRLIVEINTLERALSAQNALISEPSKNIPVRISKSAKPSTKITKRGLPANLHASRDIVIAIDAGHGGIDSGAIGQGGTQEKEIVLAIAKDLAALVAEERGMRAVLIRNGDYFVKLRKRIQLAHQYQADLFISIHADAYPNDSSVQGASVYMLSHGGASSEAASFLAEKENAADLMGGISLSDKDELLASVLFDILQAGTLEASAYLGQKILKTLRKIGNIHFSKVQRADFMVLRSPDIPSVLVETGFISNHKEEKKLSRPNHRRKIAHAIMKGIREYFENKAPPGTLLARQ